LKSCCNNAPLLIADSAGITLVTLFMATLYQLCRSGPQSGKLVQRLSDTRDFVKYGLAEGNAAGRSIHFWTFQTRWLGHAQKATPSGSKYRVPPAPVTEPSNPQHREASRRAAD
jgi:hypothetical protein